MVISTVVSVFTFHHTIRTAIILNKFDSFCSVWFSSLPDAVRFGRSQKTRYGACPITSVYIE